MAAWGHLQVSFLSTAWATASWCRLPNYPKIASTHDEQVTARRGADPGVPWNAAILVRDAIEQPRADGTRDCAGVAVGLWVAGQLDPPAERVMAASPERAGATDWAIVCGGAMARQEAHKWARGVQILLDPPGSQGSGGAVP